MSSQDCLKTSIGLLPPVSPSPQLFSSQQIEKESLQRIESSVSIGSSTHTVVHRTTSWRWVIVFSSFCVHFVADGVLFSFGILMHMIKDDLHIALHTVGIIASLFISLPLLLAPLSSALVNKWGCRLVTMLGGFLCSVGLVFASLAGTFFGAVVGIGIFCGVGLSCVYVPAVVIVAHYFDENRAIATAIAVGGTGLGNAIVAQVIHALNDYYDDWRETTLFLSGVLFAIVGFGALFRPVEFSLPRKSKGFHHAMPDTVRISKFMTSVERLQCFIQGMDKQRASNQANQIVNISKSNHETNKLGLFDSYSADDITKLKNGSIDNVVVQTCHEEMSKIKISYARRSQTENNPSDAKIGSIQFFSTHFLPVEQDTELLEVYNQPLSQKDIFYRGNVPSKLGHSSRKSCPNLLQYYVYEESLATISDDDDDDDDNGDAVDSIHSHHKHMLFYHKGLSFLHTLRRMLGLQLFCDYRYLIFFISQFLFYLFYDLVYLFPIDYGESVIGYSKKQMTMLVTVLGFGQFFGQIMFGLLANYSRINELILYDVGAALCGLASLLIPFVVYSYPALIMIILLFGLSISANYALTSVILANMCGLELLTSAYGLILLGQGVSSLSGPIIGGLIAEKYGYKSSLILAGICMGLSGIVTLMIPLIQRLRNNQEDKNNEKTIKTSTTTSRLDHFG
ncbi:unnamed protein product [Rotaria socialis]|uniref:Major facilitator superfamily (MFS) profile domain-containing protein n=1 Tax=Rotaria socialis TaxID=392032 RepID=A0A817T9S7_9BILA|nr:unnamed protein product [Rotaria socialis]CAF4337466.1 unnamed protein product [Rotaria socialis]